MAPFLALASIQMDPEALLTQKNKASSQWVTT